MSDIYEAAANLTRDGNSKPLNDLEISPMYRAGVIVAVRLGVARSRGKVNSLVPAASFRVTDRGRNVNLTTNTVTIAPRTSCELLQPRSIRYTEMDACI